jgi:uncharacterized membrane protein YgaE (UPF0421/DUF939 family)
MVNATDGTTSRLSWRGALVHGAGAAFVAVFCYSTARLVPSLPEPYWAPIAAVVVLYPDHEATRKAAGQRFLGTALGSLVGWASAAWWHGNIVLYALFVLVAVGLSYLLRLEAAARLCAVAVTVITLIPRTEPAHLVAFHRFVVVSYGVACALAYTMSMDRARRRWRGGGGRQSPES